MMQIPEELRHNHRFSRSRRWFRYWFRPHCRIVYRSEYLTSIHAQNAYRAFDVMKFKKIRDQLIQERLVRRKHILPAEPLTDADLLTVHDKKYVLSLKNPGAVGRALALDYINPWDNYVFEYFLYVAGGSVIAVEHAFAHNQTVFNLGGGYHHAHRDRAEGFCLINDVAIAITRLRRSHPGIRVLVVDLDYHQGNGVARFFENDPDVFTYSLNAEKWEEINPLSNLDVAAPRQAGAEEYLQLLKNTLPDIFYQFKPELVIYLAGADPFVLDTLGDLNVSERGMLERDIFVYNLVRSNACPMAVLAAGGYGPESWRVYFNFIKWTLKYG